jgi:hypothetical protein
MPENGRHPGLAMAITDEYSCNVNIIALIHSDAGKTGIKAVMQSRNIALKVFASIFLVLFCMNALVQDMPISILSETTQHSQLRATPCPPSSLL